MARIYAKKLHEHFFQVVHGHSLFALDVAMNLLRLAYVKLVPIVESQYIWATRTPVRISSLNNAVRPFQPIVWLALLVTLSLFSLMLFTTHSVYKQIHHPGLVKEDVPTTDFLIIPFTAFFEPEVMPWFSKNTGK